MEGNPLQRATEMRFRTPTTHSRSRAVLRAPLRYLRAPSAVKMFEVSEARPCYPLEPRRIVQSSLTPLPHSRKPFPTSSDNAPRKSGSGAGEATLLYASNKSGTRAFEEASSLSFNRSILRI